MVGFPRSGAVLFEELHEILDGQSQIDVVPKGSPERVSQRKCLAHLPARTNKNIFTK